MKYSKELQDKEFEEFSRSEYFAPFLYGIFALLLTFLFLIIYGLCQLVIFIVGLL